MKTLQFTIRFETPAFLGNAEQNGQWRTPPFKALLRQWWRVAYAAQHRFALNMAEMREREGHLFGHAWLENDHDAQNNKVAARKSQIRIRLDRWDAGTLTQWPNPEATVTHPEVGQGGAQVGSALYLGYGPLMFQRGTAFKANAAIQFSEAAELSIAVPDTEAALIEHALRLMHRYGTAGGRSRNGWGSFSLLPLPPGEGWGEGGLPLRNWKDCLKLDWPHALGQDNRGPLIWKTAPCTDWKAVMKRLAEIKIGLRTQFIFPDERPPHRQVQDRHWLSYPVTNHATTAWDRNARLPNSLRFKVRPLSDGKLVGAIFHVPCLPPAAFAPNLQAIEGVWTRVHQFLDAPAQQLTRIAE